MYDNIEKLESLKKIEFLKNAKADAGNAASSLRLAAQNSNAVEGIVILGLIERAVILERDIEALISAITSTEKEA